MISKYKTLMLASVFFFAGTFSVVAQETPQLPDLNQNSAQQEKVDPNHVLATINGKKITAGELDKIAMSINPDLMQIPPKKRQVVLMRYYVDSLALNDAADKIGLDKTEEFVAMLKEARANVLQRIYYQKEITDKISDADLKTRYEKVIAEMPKEEEVHARHILLANKADAVKIIAQLNKGAKFEDVAKKSSTDDGSATLGGDLGYFSKDQMVKPFSDVAFTLKPGTYTKTPVETPFGWHVIFVEDIRQKPVPTFDDLKEEIRNVIARENYQKIILELRNKIDIKYLDDDLAKATAAKDAEGEEEGEGEESDVPSDSLPE